MQTAARRRIAMKFLLLASILILIHFLAYCLWLRKLKSFRSERSIFLYHLWSGAILAAAIIVGGSGVATLPQSIGALSMHGIYSLSFLEIWSLSQGSYSISILIAASRRGILKTSDLKAFVDIGDAKQAARLHALERLRLICTAGDTARLTIAGQLAAAALGMFCRLSNLKHVG
jgi:hypothetical protein